MTDMVEQLRNIHGVEVPAHIDYPNGVPADEPETDDVDGDGDVEGYETLTVAELKAEIDARNEGREEDNLIVPEAPGNKPELVAALEADDESSDEE